MRVDADRLVFVGNIAKASAAAFAWLVSNGQVGTLVIHSPGGDVEAALDIAEEVVRRAMQVEVQADCASSCANHRFPAGRHKTIPTGAMMRWHGNVAHLAYLDKADAARSTPEVRLHPERLSARERRFFGSIGVDGFICWFAKLHLYHVPDTYALTTEDMAYFGIRQVSAPTSYAAQDLASPGSGGVLNAVAVRWNKATVSSLRQTVSYDNPAAPQTEMPHRRRVDDKR